MTVIKGSQEFRTILDFSRNKISKNKIKQALRHVEVLEIIHHKDTKSYTIIENDITVGMYQIRLAFYSLSTEQRSRLKEYGGFRVSIYEHVRGGKGLQNINIPNDKRFQGLHWVPLNKDYKLRSNDLIDIIMHARRLNDLKMFL